MLRSFVRLFAVWVVVMSIVPHAGGPAGLMIPFWWFFVLIDAVRQAKDRTERRINKFGVAEPLIQKAGADRIPILVLLATAAWLWSSSRRGRD